MAQCIAEYRLSSAFGMNKTDSFVAELLSKEPVFLIEIIDCLLLLFIEGSSTDDAEQLPWVELRSHD